MIYIIKPNLSQLTDYPEFHDLDSIRWSVIGIGSNYVALTRDTDLALHTRDGRIRGVVANRHWSSIEQWFLDGTLIDGRLLELVALDRLQL